MPLFQPTADLSLAQLAYGEAIVAAYLGALRLDEHTVTVSWDTLGTAGTVLLPQGPVTGIVSASSYGVPFLGLGISPWALRFSQAFTGQLTVVLRLGWTESNVPEQIRQAVYLMASRYGLGGVSAHAVGPISYSFDRSSTLPPEVGLLLRPWRRITI